MRRNLAAVLLVFLSGTIGAEDAPDPKAEAEAAGRLNEREAARWSFRLEGDRELTRKPEAVLRWSNPNIGRVYGDVHLWLDRGCPAALGSFFTWYTPYDDCNAELKSLGRGKLVGLRADKVLWEPKEEDVSFGPLKDTGTPDDDAAQRLRQMRRLAPEFEISLRDSRLQGGEGTRQELRLLTQPIYRYVSKDPSIVDGAVFAYVIGTDPEALLLLEARKSNATTRWEFALVRLNNEELRCTRNGEEIWTVPPVAVHYETEAPYLLLPFPKESP